MQKNHSLAKGVCKKCGCTWNNPCHHADLGYCWWEDESETLCSHCVDPEIEDGSEHCVNRKK